MKKLKLFFSFLIVSLINVLDIFKNKTKTKNTKNMNSYIKIGKSILNHSNKAILPVLARNSNRAICLVKQVAFCVFINISFYI